jgi:hypothetical protein
VNADRPARNVSDDWYEGGQQGVSVGGADPDCGVSRPHRPGRSRTEDHAANDDGHAGEMRVQVSLNVGEPGCSTGQARCQRRSRIDSWDMIRERCDSARLHATRVEMLSLPKGSRKRGNLVSAK